MAIAVDDRFRGATNVSRALEGRYLCRDRDRKIAETPSQLYERVARAVSSANSLSATHATLVVAGSNSWPC
jgi:ribonucleotide reductase alpha subunit